MRNTSHSVVYFSEHQMLLLESTLDADRLMSSGGTCCLALSLSASILLFRSVSRCPGALIELMQLLGLILAALGDIRLCAETAAAAADWSSWLDERIWLAEKAGNGSFRGGLNVVAWWTGGDCRFFCCDVSSRFMFNMVWSLWTRNGSDCGNKVGLAAAAAVDGWLGNRAWCGR